MPKLLPRPSVVYIAYNKVTGGIYVGFTSCRMQQRKARHLSAARCGQKTSFAEAIRTYGYESFTWHVVGTFSTAADACVVERALIKKLRPAYNATKGGEGYKLKITSEEGRQSLRAAALRNIRRWRRFAKLGPASMARRVVCLDDGRSYPSASAAARAYRTNKSAIIEVCLRHSRRRTAGGRVFRYADDANLGQDDVLKLKHGARKGGSNPFQGVYRHVSDGKDTGRWRARVSVGGRKNLIRYSVGIFETAEEAHAARLAAITALKKGRRPKWLRDHTQRERRPTQRTAPGVHATGAAFSRP